MTTLPLWTVNSFPRPFERSRIDGTILYQNGKPHIYSPLDLSSYEHKSAFLDA